MTGLGYATNILFYILKTLRNLCFGPENADHYVQVVGTYDIILMIQYGAHNNDSWFFHQLQCTHLDFMTTSVAMGLKLSCQRILQMILEKSLTIPDTGTIAAVS